MKSVVRKMGNASGVIIPQPLLREVGAKRGDVVEVQVKGGTIVIVPAAVSSREGWAEDAKRIAAAERTGGARAETEFWERAGADAWDDLG